MKTATVTYVAPFGDNKVVEMGGIGFEDGKPVEINDHDNPHLFTKLQAHGLFDFTMGKDEPDTVKPKVKRGRPSAADLAERKAAADKAEQDHKDAAAKAEAAKAEVDDAVKASEAKDAAPTPPTRSAPSPVSPSLADKPAS